MINEFFEVDLLSNMAATCASNSIYLYSGFPEDGFDTVGFRIANLESVPEPSSILMILIGCSIFVVRPSN